MGARVDSRVEIAPISTLGLRTTALRLKPALLSAEVQRPELLARLADQIPLADEDPTAPPNRLAHRPVAPPGNGAATAGGAEGQVLEAHDLGNGAVVLGRGHGPYVPRISR